MTELKSLVKETAIYGVSSIVGRFLNYLLVPIYTLTMPASSGSYGVITQMYAITALLLVLLTCGMETGFFRFANKADENPIRVYSTTLLTVGGISLSFLAICLLLLKPIAGVMGYAEHPWYLGMMMIVISMDAIQSIPFAYLRYQKKAIKFASLKMLFIISSILLNIIYFVLMKGTNVGAAFLINLICTSIVMLCFMPELCGFSYVLDKKLMRRMLSYSFPIMILGIAGILNQVADRIIFPFVYPDRAEAEIQLGIYGATSKIAMIMAMAIQAFRFAYEPFVFGKSRESDNREMYAQAMKFFIIFALLGFIAVMFYLDILKYLIGRDYWEGLRVVPIVMAAEMFMGVYFNLSFWYKLTDDTRWGAYFSLTACVVVVVLNITLIPRFSYMACAWAGFSGYAVAMLLSYFVGQKRYPIAYDIKGIGGYVLCAAALCLFGLWLPIENIVLRLLVRTALIFVYLIYIVRHDLPLQHIPVINRFVKH
jgi:O-antigen/teichoic acid export membrane protein